MSERKLSISEGIEHGPYNSISLPSGRSEWLALYKERYKDEPTMTQVDIIQQIESEWQYDCTTEKFEKSEISSDHIVERDRAIHITKTMELWFWWPKTPEQQISAVLRYNRAAYSKRA